MKQVFMLNWVREELQEKSTRRYTSSQGVEVSGSFKVDPDVVNMESGPLTKVCKLTPNEREEGERQNLPLELSSLMKSSGARSASIPCLHTDLQPQHYQQHWPDKKIGPQSKMRI
jgi:hypothetical protein